MTQKVETDHFVIASKTIEQGVNYIQSKLNITIPTGGSHPKMGTHNHLMNLGSTFLEVIAIDPDANATRKPRWYNLDSPQMQKAISEEPQLITWVARTTNIEETHKQSAHPETIIETVSRGSLTWKITVPKDGSLPDKGLYPTFIQWPDDIKPWENMQNLGYQFEKLLISSPDAESICQSLKNVELLDNNIEFANSTTNKMNLKLLKNDNSMIDFESTQTVN